MDLLRSAGLVAGEVRTGRLAAADIVAAAITTAEAQQDRLNICTSIDGERARERAAQIDAAVESGDDPGPLAGVPIALKDIFDHAGRVTTAGSGFYRHDAGRSATVVTRLEEAGAVIVSRTGLHEFAYGFSSENDWFGPVRNPLDPELSPGGSSGGSAAAVAAGQVPIALGTDTGGSVRVPAALCGVYGLKVTHGRVPLDGVFPLAPSLDTVGPLAGSAADLGLAYQAIAGHSAADPWSVERPVQPPGASPPDLQGLRIAIPVPWVDEGPTSREVEAAFEEAIGALRSMGASTELYHDPELVPWGRIQDIAGGEVASVHRTWWSERRPYGEEVGARIGQAMTVDLDSYIEAQRWRAGLRGRFDRVFQRFDLIATPTTAVLRKRIGLDEVPTSSGSSHYRPALSWFTALVNHAGHPAIALPLSSTDGGPPPSLQLIAAAWMEHRLLAVAATLEREGVVSPATAS